jgi:hypothetical protein
MGWSKCRTASDVQEQIFDKYPCLQPTHFHDFESYKWPVQNTFERRIVPAVKCSWIRYIVAYILRSEKAVELEGGERRTKTKQQVSRLHSWLSAAKSGIMKKHYWRSNGRHIIVQAYFILNLMAASQIRLPGEWLKVLECSEETWSMQMGGYLVIMGIKAYNVPEFRNLYVNYAP